jgi:hypothetical protein
LTRPSRPRPAVLVYAQESRDVGLSLLLVLPLLLAYEIAMLLVNAPVRNGAEMVVADFLQRLSPEGLVLLRRGLMLLLLVLALVLVQQHPPNVARAHWLLAEALVFAVLLGPTVGWLVGGVGLSLPTSSFASGSAPWLPFLLSVGAGLWEEIVFRLALLGGLALLGSRLLGWPTPVAVAFATLASALTFALYHHLGHHGEALTLSRFVFRAVAGTILGLLFVFRGFAVVVYLHVFYDLLCDLRALDG